MELVCYLDYIDLDLCDRNDVVGVSKVFDDCILLTLDEPTLGLATQDQCDIFLCLEHLTEYHHRRCIEDLSLQLLPGMVSYLCADPCDGIFLSGV